MRFKPKSVLLKPSPELSYILGVYYGDGSASHTRKSRHYNIKLAAKDKEFVVEFRRCLSIILPDKFGSVCLCGDGRYSFTVCRKGLYEFLKKPLEEHKLIIGEFPAMFLRGFYDSEGGISYRKRWDSVIYACNTNLALLQYVGSLLLSFSIHPRLRLKCKAGSAPHKIRNKTVRRTKDYYRLRFYKQDNILKFYEKIGFTIQRKQDRLVNLVENLSKSQSAGLVLEGASSQVRFSTNQTDGRREVRVGGSKSSRPINGGSVSNSQARARGGSGPRFLEGAYSLQFFASMAARPAALG